MATTNVDLQAVLSVKDRMTGGLNKAGGGLAKLTGIVAGTAAAVGGLSIAIGAKAVQSAAKFDTAIRNIGTLLGSTAGDEMPKFKKGIREIARELPVDPNELGAAAYNVVSAGISDTAEALEVLKQSSRLAVAGLSTTEEAVNILTSAINVYGDENHDANRIAEILFLTVKNGKTTIAELAQGFGKVAGIAKETGIEIEDLSAATALLTTTGITASEAQTSLKAMISNVLKPTKDATEASKRLGIQFDLAALQADGLSGMLATIQEAAGDDKQALADLFGSVEAANSIFTLTSEEGGEAFRRMLEEMQEEGNTLDGAVKIQTESMAAKWRIFQNTIDEVVSGIGDTIIELGGDKFDFLIDRLKELPRFVDEKIKPKLRGIFEAIGKFYQQLVIIWQDRIQPAFTVAFEKIKPFKDEIQKIAEGIGGTAAYTILGAILAIPLAIASVIGLFGQMLQVVSDITGKVWELVNAIKDAAQRMRDIVTAPGSPIGTLLGKAAGGPVNRGTPYIVGERGPEMFVPNQGGTIVPNSQMTGGNGITVNFNNPIVRNDMDMHRIIAAVKETLRRDSTLQRIGV